MYQQSLLATDYTTPSPSQTNLTGGNTAGNLALTFSIFGAVSGALGSFYKAKQTIYELETSAINSRYLQGTANQNAEQAEFMADDYMKRGHEQIAQRTTQAAHQKSALAVSVGKRGIAGGVGSAGEIEESIELAKDADYFIINANAVRASEGAKLQSVRFKNQALIYGVNADIAKRRAASIDPSQRAFTSLLTGASQVSLAYMRYGA